MTNHSVQTVINGLTKRWSCYRNTDGSLIAISKTVGIFALQLTINDQS